MTDEQQRDEPTGNGQTPKGDDPFGGTVVPAAVSAYEGSSAQANAESFV